MPVDVILGENGDVCIAIEPPGGARLGLDFLCLRPGGRLDLATTDGKRHALGRLQPEMESALAGLSSAVVVQIIEGGAAAHAEEVPVSREG
jgi:hypothetical protein